LNDNTDNFPPIALARPGQTLLAHSIGVGDGTAAFCPELDAWARLVGLLHDYGKYRPEWVAGMNDIAQGKGTKKLPYHSLEGALHLMRLFPDPKQFKVGALAIAIHCHHTGLPDSRAGMESLHSKTMNDRNWRIDPEYSEKLATAITAVNYADLDDWLSPNDYGTAQKIRYLYGCLIVADRQDAAMSRGWKPATYPSMETLATNLANWYARKYGNPQTKIDRLRCDFYRDCRQGGDIDAQWLSVRGPCGISKTWSVMQLALNVAHKQQKKRVVYCVPWTAILEQSYDEYRKELGEKNVLGHWSTLVEQDTTQDPQIVINTRQWWDAPIVATTMVQLFDILMGASARTAQRMPSLKDAVIILDEVQGLPDELVIPCIKILDRLASDFNTTIILSTATMPDYKLLDINPVEVISPAKVNSYFEEIKRVDYEWRDTTISWQEIADEIEQSPLPSTLIVTNTVAGCNDAYETMSRLKDYRVYKYTAKMSPAHREVVLKEIKIAIDAAKNGGQKVIICATSAIETGVDIDCSRGYRELSGLDAIVQFAGRINRNQNDGENSPVVIFKTAKEYKLPPSSSDRTNRTKKARAKGTDLQSPEVLQEYSRLIFQSAKDSLKNRNVYDYLKHLARLEWESVSNKWQMIAPTHSVLIDPRKWNANAEIVAEFDRAIADMNYRVLQRHCIGLYKREHKERIEDKSIVESQVKGLYEFC
jgi:CRISPR-associated endonuclease/helicase Cas3